MLKSLFFFGFEIFAPKIDTESLEREREREREWENFFVNIKTTQHLKILLEDFIIFLRHRFPFWRSFSPHLDSFLRKKCQDLSWDPHHNLCLNHKTPPCCALQLFSFFVFRFVIECSGLRGFWPLGNNNRSIFIWGFLKDDILACVEESWD